MHPEAMDWAARAVAGRSFGLAVEIGSLDINGSVRSLVDAERYVGVDLQDGPGVDVVADALDWEPDSQADLVLCLEVLEHAPRWRDVVRKAASWLTPRGLMVVTCATHGRAPHSAVDGRLLDEDEWNNNPWCAPSPGVEFYDNVDGTDLAATLQNADMIDIRTDVLVLRCDLRATATKGDAV